MSVERFIDAQKADYDIAFREISNGRKEVIICGIYFLKSKV